MVTLLLFSIASVGLTAIMVDGKIFAPVRERIVEHVRLLERLREKGKKEKSWTVAEFLYGIITCYQCCGFWCGLICGLFLITGPDFYFVVSIKETRSLLLTHTILTWFCCGFAGSLLAHTYFWVLELVVAATRYLQAITPHFHTHEQEQLEEDEG